MTENKALAVWDGAVREEVGSGSFWVTLLLELCIWFWLLITELMETSWTAFKEKFQND